MMTDNTDERFQISDTAIRDAFFLVLKEKELEKITVSDVIKKAGIVRSTFYNHYENIPALISAIEDRSIQEIFTLMKSFHPKNDRELCKSYFLSICEYTKTNPFVVFLLGNPDGNGTAFFEKLLNMFHHYVSRIAMNSTPSVCSRTEYSYRVAITIGGTIGVLHKWTREDCRMPAEQIADILTQTFISGVLPYMI